MELTPIEVNDVPIAAFFRAFTAEVQSCPLYVALCPILADLDATIGLYRDAAPTQRRPNLLLAAMHASLLRDPNHRLARWYPTVGGSSDPGDPELSSIVSDFIGARTDELAALVGSGATQTNEVGRSPLIAAALDHVLSDFEQPIHLVELGPSAGLNLRLDHYRLHFVGTDGTIVSAVGPESSPVQIRCNVERSVEVPSFDRLRSSGIAHRIGIDLNPLNVADPVQRRWLKALIWPDDLERFHRLDAALELAATSPVELLAGDAVTGVTSLLRDVAPNHQPVVLSTWVITYLTPAQRSELTSQLDAFGATRDFSWIAMESPHYCPGIPWPDELWAIPERDRVHSAIVEFSYRNGRRNARWLGTAHPHGRWLNWHPTTGAALPRTKTTRTTQS